MWVSGESSTPDRMLWAKTGCTVYQAERIRGQANKNPHRGSLWGFRTETIPHAPRTAKEGFVKAIEGGLLTLGSSYWPTPSQRYPRQWRLPLAFVPDHSGASVRDLHPLPNSSTSIAVTTDVDIWVSFGATDVKHVVALPDVAM
jgi:hypothetical protein